MTSSTPHDYRSENYVAMLSAWHSLRMQHLSFQIQEDSVPEDGRYDMSTRFLRTADLDVLRAMEPIELQLDEMSIAGFLNSDVRYCQDLNGSSLLSHARKMFCTTQSPVLKRDESWIIYGLSIGGLWEDVYKFEIVRNYGVYKDLSPEAICRGIYLGALRIQTVQKLSNDEAIQYLVYQCQAEIV